MSPAIITALGWALVHFVWQGALIWIGCVAALFLLRGVRPQVRYALACGALVLSVACPIVGTLGNLPGAVGDPGQPAVHTPVAPSVGEPIIAAVARAEDAGMDLDGAIRPYLPLVVLLWGAGSLLLALRMATGVAWATRLARSQTEPKDDAWTARFHQLAERIGAGRRVLLKVSRAIDTPLAVGWWRPVVVVPASLLTGMAPSLVEALLAHELAHVRRYDYLVSLLQGVAELLLFYHPAVWWISKRIRQEREQVADDLAVIALGEPRRLALALQELDRWQIAALQPAQAATGGTLMTRIRRLVRPERRPLAWRAAFCVLVLASMSMVGAVSGLQRQPDPGLLPRSIAPRAVGVPPQAGDIRSRPRDVARQAGSANQSQAALTGDWHLTLRPGKQEDVQLELSRTSGTSHSNWGETFRSSALAGFDPAVAAKGGAARFELRRAAGTIHFEGRFEKGEGSGQFRFVPSSDYISAMKSLGYASLAVADLFTLAMTDITPRFVKDMNAVGYRDIPLDKLISLGIHGATPEFAKSMRGILAQVPTLDQLISLRIHGAEPDATRQMQDVLGKTLVADQVISLRIHGATPDYVRQMKDTTKAALTSDQVVSLRIHGATPDETKRLQDLLGTTMTPDQIVTVRIHGVSAEFAAAMREQMGQGLTVDQLVSFRIHGASPEFVRSMKAVGYDRITPDQLVSMRIHGVDADFARRARERTGKTPTIDELVSMRIRGR